MEKGHAQTEDSPTAACIPVPIVLDPSFVFDGGFDRLLTILPARESLSPYSGQAVISCSISWGIETFFPMT